LVGAVPLDPQAATYHTSATPDIRQTVPRLLLGALYRHQGGHEELSHRDLVSDELPGRALTGKGQSAAFQYETRTTSMVETESKILSKLGGTVGSTEYGQVSRPAAFWHRCKSWLCAKPCLVRIPTVSSWTDVYRMRPTWRES